MAADCEVTEVVDVDVGGVGVDAEAVALFVSSFVLFVFLLTAGVGIELFVVGTVGAVVSRPPFAASRAFAFAAAIIALVRAAVFERELITIGRSEIKQRSKAQPKGTRR